MTLAVQLRLSNINTFFVLKQKSTLKNEELLDPQKLEKIIYKQQFLEKMNLFNPTKYFSGIESTTFEDILLDRRLGEMFMEELPIDDDNDKGFFPLRSS